MALGDRKASPNCIKCEGTGILKTSNGMLCPCTDPSVVMVSLPPADPINPGHYKGDLVMRIIERFGLGFRLGNVVKYILRHGEKAGLEDLKKSRWYLDREIAALEGKVEELK